MYDSSESLNTLLSIGQILYVVSIHSAHLLSSTNVLSFSSQLFSCFPCTSYYGTIFGQYFPTEALTLFLLSPPYRLGITTAIEQEVEVNH